jgi:hypothetical protein
MDITEFDHVLTPIVRDALTSVGGGSGDRAAMFQRRMCTEAAWRDRRANYDQWGSTIAAEEYCDRREPGSWAARANRGLR